MIVDYTTYQTLGNILLGFLCLGVLMFFGSGLCENKHEWIPILGLFIIVFSFVGVCFLSDYCCTNSAEYQKGYNDYPNDTLYQKALTAQEYALHDGHTDGKDERLLWYITGYETAMKDVNRPVENEMIKYLDN